MIVRLTELQRRRLESENGEQLGRLHDLVVRLDPPEPRIVRARVRRGRHLGEIDSALVRLGATLVVSDPGRLEEPRLADDELLLGRHVLDAQIVDLAGKRVTRVGDLELDLDQLTVAGVCIGLEPVLRRLGLSRLAGRARSESLAWRNLHLTSRRGHALMLRAPAAALHRARPDSLAHLVARLPHRHAHEVLGAVDPQTAQTALRAPAAQPPRFPFRWIRRRATP